MVTANSGEVGKIGDDRGLLAAEGQVDEILQLEKLQLVRHRLKLRGLTGVKAVQPFGEVVQLLHIDHEHFHSLENGVEAVDLLHLAVCLDRVTDFQRRQQFHAVCVLVAGDGERDSCYAVFQVAGVTENRLNHHLLLLSISSISVRRQPPPRCQQTIPWAGYGHPRHRSFSVQNTGSGGIGTNAVQVRLSTLRLIPSLMCSSFRVTPDYLS